MLTWCIVLQHKQEEADEVKRKLAEESRSDHIALLRAYEVHTKYITYTSIVCCALTIHDRTYKLYIQMWPKYESLLCGNYHSHLCIYTSMKNHDPWKNVANGCFILTNLILALRDGKTLVMREMLETTVGSISSHTTLLRYIWTQNDYVCKSSGWCNIAPTNWSLTQAKFCAHKGTYFLYNLHVKYSSRLTYILQREGRRGLHIFSIEI